MSFDLLSSRLLEVVSLVEALIVKVSVNRDPIGIVDSSPILCRRTLREGTSDLNPASLALCDCANFVGHFREILILANDKCHVVCTVMSKPNYINRNSYIDTFLLSDQKRMLCPV